VALVSTRALILQTFPYSDTSKIVRFLSAEVGVRSVIAKGALRPRSRFGGLLEPFAEGDAQFFLKEGRDLHTLTGFDLTRSRQAIGRNLTAFAGCSLMAELALRFGTDEPQPALFHAIRGALERVIAPDSTGAAAAALTGVWQIVAILGYEPQLDGCVVCARAVSADEPTRFDMVAGGVACTTCRPTGRLVDPVTRDSVAAMLAGRADVGSGSDWSLHRALLRAFLATHLSSEQPLRSLDLFIEELGADSWSAGEEPAFP